MRRFPKLLIALFLIMFVSLTGIIHTPVHAGVKDFIEDMQKKLDRKIYEELETSSVTPIQCFADKI